MVWVLGYLFEIPTDLKLGHMPLCTRGEPILERLAEVLKVMLGCPVPAMALTLPWPQL